MSEVPDVGFLLLPLPGFALLPFGGFVDKLRFSADDEDHSRQRYCRWQTLGLVPGQPVAASSGVELLPGATPDRLDWRQFRYLVIFGARSAEQSRVLAPQYRPLLRQATAHGLSLVSVDNACFLLAEAGMLEGHRVAVHWRHGQEFASAFPGIEMSTDALYIEDRTRISCAGGSAAIELATVLLARHCGPERARKGLADMLVDAPRAQQHRLSSQDPEAGHDRLLLRALALMRQHLAGGLSIEQLATRVGLSRRQLDRRFNDRFGRPARAQWQEMRLQHLAWRLCNADHPLGRLAEEIGAGDTSLLIKQFRRRFGMTPGRYRREAMLKGERQPDRRL